VLRALDTEVQNAMGAQKQDGGPPADADRQPEPETGSSGADQGISPLSPESYEQEDKA
jgi:hypothetical protein